MQIKDAINHLDSALKRKKVFDIGAVLSSGFDIWKMYWHGFTGIAVLLMVVNLILSYVPYAGSMINYLLLSPVIVAGGAIVAHRIYKNAAFGFKGFFQGFRFTWSILLYTIMAFLLYLLLLSPIIASIGLVNVYVLEDGGIQDIRNIEWSSFQAWTLLFLIPLAYLALALSYSVLFIAFYKLDPFRAMRYSVKFVNRNWAVQLLYIILIYLISISGVLLIFIGLFVTLGMYYPLLYISFNRLTDLDQYLTNAIV